MKTQSKNAMLNETHHGLAKLLHKFPVIVQEFPILVSLWIMMILFADYFK